MDTYPGFQMPLAFDLRNLTKHSPVVPSEDGDDYQINTRGEHLTSYGINPLRRFLANNDLLCVIRGHEQKPEGFQLSKYGPTYDFPACITIFSCPNYTDRSMNDGALLVRLGSGADVFVYARVRRGTMMAAVLRGLFATGCYPLVHLSCAHAVHHR